MVVTMVTVTDRNPNRRIAKLSAWLRAAPITIGAMSIQYPPVGSKWKERDLRVARTVQVVRYDAAKRRIRIVCLETDRLTWAKVERFNGKSGGYAPLSAPPQGAKSPQGKSQPDAGGWRAQWRSKQ
jgi:hypothetical protein